MADGKKSFVGYCDWIAIFDKLDDNEAGKLIKHFLSYVNDLNPEAPDRLTMLMFEPIKLQLKRDLKKWEQINTKRSDAGKRSAELKKQQKSTLVEFDEQNKQALTNSTVNDNVNVTVTVNDNVTIPNTGQDFQKKKKEDMVVVEMMKIWMNHNPNYFEEKENDYTACLQIAYKIAKYKRWKEVDVVGLKEKDVLSSWDKICLFIRSDTFLKKLPVTSIANQFQMVVQKMNNPTENENKPLNSPVSTQTNPNIKPATDEMVDKYRKPIRNAVTNP